MTPGNERRPWRVIQWTTGDVAREAVQAVLIHPELELVGGYAYSAEKVGQDIGELCGLRDDARPTARHVGLPSPRELGVQRLRRSKPRRHSLLRVLRHRAT